MTNVKQAVTALDSALTELTDRIVQAQKRVADLEAQAERTEKRLARGTSDMSDELLTAEWSPIATKSDDRLPLPIELERVLRAQPISTYDAATLLGVPVAHVAKVLRDLRRAHKVVNAGTHDQPLWSWVLGDEGTTTDLTAKVEQLLRLRPMTLQELGDITGARRNRISGALVILRRHGIQIDNTGNGFRAVWSIQSPKSTRRGF